MSIAAKLVLLLACLAEVEHHAALAREAFA